MLFLNEEALGKMLDVKGVTESLSWVSAFKQLRLSNEEKQIHWREEDSTFGFHSENIVAETGFKSGFNICVFRLIL